MPERKWIHRSRNRKPDSLNNAIEPSLERTAGQALPSFILVVVEVLILLFVVLDIGLGLELVFIEVIVVVVLVVVIVFVVEIVEVVVGVLIILVVFVVVRLVLAHLVIIQLGQSGLSVVSPRPIAEPRHQTLLRTIPVQNFTTGVVAVGQRSAGL
jgi:hypothetical protein